MTHIEVVSLSAALLFIAGVLLFFMGSDIPDKVEDRLTDKSKRKGGKQEW